MADLVEVLKQNTQETPTVQSIDGKANWVISNAVLLNAQDNKDIKLARLSISAENTDHSPKLTIVNGDNNLLVNLEKNRDFKIGIPELTIVNGKHYWAMPIVAKEPSVSKARKK